MFAYIMMHMVIGIDFGLFFQSLGNLVNFTTNSIANKGFIFHHSHHFRKITDLQALFLSNLECRICFVTDCLQCNFFFIMLCNFFVSTLHFPTSKNISVRSCDLVDKSSDFETQVTGFESYANGMYFLLIIHLQKVTIIFGVQGKCR